MDIEINNLSQGEAAELMQVDRTTIRAWTKQGMPYVEPPVRGAEATYTAFVLIHWRMWQGFRKACRVPALTPLQAVAFMRAISVLDGGEEALDDYYRHGTKSFEPYLERGAIRSLLDFSLGFATAWMTKEGA